MESLPFDVQVWLAYLVFFIAEGLKMTLGFSFFFTNILLGVGLAMDAFSVSLANGLHEPCMKTRKMCGIAGYAQFLQRVL